MYKYHIFCYIIIYMIHASVIQTVNLSIISHFIFFWLFLPNSSWKSWFCWPPVVKVFTTVHFTLALLSLMRVLLQPAYQEITDGMKKVNNAQYTIYFTTSHPQLCWADWRQRCSLYAYSIPLLRPLSNQPWCAAPHDSAEVRPSHSFNRPLIFPIYYCMSVSPLRAFFLLPFLPVHSSGEVWKKEKKKSWFLIKNCVVSHHTHTHTHSL